MEPKNGFLIGNSRQAFNIRIRPNKVGLLNNIIVPCYLKDLDYPIFLKINIVSKGIAVEYQVSATQNENIYQKFLPSFKTAINFNDVSFTKPSMKCLLIKNKTPISSKMTISNKVFKKSIKLGEEADKGVSIALDKNEIFIPPNGTLSICLTVTSTIWGNYNDTLELCIEKSGEIQQIPIIIDSNQSPLKIFSGMVTENSEEIPYVRFGTQIQGKNPVNRKFKMKNQCNIGFEIEWNVFIVEKNRKKFVDMNLIFPQEQEATNRNLFKIHLTEHYGKRDTSLFYLDSYKTTVNPYDIFNVDLFLNLDTDFSGDIEAIFIGYIILLPELHKGHSFERKSSFFYRPIKFKTTAHIAVPSFTITNFDESTLNFDIPLGDLIKDGKVITLFNPDQVF